MDKDSRQELIARLVREKRLSTQAQLVAALAENGCRATQATVSRDIREMGIRKGIDGTGNARYLLPSPGEIGDAEAALMAALKQARAVIRAAGNLVVVRGEPGTAPGLGRAADELADDNIVGTVAGDDTLLLVVVNKAAAERTARRLQELRDMESEE